MLRQHTARLPPLIDSCNGHFPTSHQVAPRLWKPGRGKMIAIPGAYVMKDATQPIGLASDLYQPKVA